MGPIWWKGGNSRLSPSISFLLRSKFVKLHNEDIVEVSLVLVPPAALWNSCIINYTVPINPRKLSYFLVRKPQEEFSHRPIDVTFVQISFKYFSYFFIFNKNY
jgi:hypothetical protein